MKKISRWLAVSIASILVIGAVAGCTLAQVSAVAQQAGIASAVTWISVYNPTDAQKVVAEGIVAVVKSNSAAVATGQSYFATLNPVVNTYITKYVAAKHQPIAKLAGGWVLTGVDTFFAMYPQYASNTVQAVSVVNAFCDGANVGFAMSKDSPVIKAATRGSVEMTTVRKSIQ